MISQQENSPDSQTVLNQIVLDYMKEKRRKRRVRWIFGFSLLVFFGIYFIVHKGSEKNLKPHIGYLELRGEISEHKEGSAENFIKGLNRAYKAKGLGGIIVLINSPGGSPVQADYIYQALMQYRKARPSVKIYAVCSDYCTSAAYYAATAAEKIYANEASLVGSIGVIYNGFGFVEAMKKLGITRRLEIAGVNKGFMDPFSDESPAHKALLQKRLDEIHQIFISRVKAGRGIRLKIDEQTFSGLFWTGVDARERGLIDGFASVRQLATAQGFKQIIDYSYQQSVVDRLSRQLGAEIANHLPFSMQNQAILSLG